MNESSRIKVENPITEVEAKTLKKKSLEWYRIQNQALMAQRDDFIRQLREARERIKEYQDFLSLLRDVRKDALYRD